MRGDGRLFKYKKSRFWWIAYSVDGREIRESTHEEDETKARKMLRRRVADVLRGDVVPNDRKVTVGDLFDMVTADYDTKKLRSRGTIKYPLQHLLDYFGATAKAVTITTDRLRNYVRERQAAGAATASINMELALLGRGYNLAKEARLLRDRPVLPKLPSDPSAVRQGFFTRREVEALCKHLPSDIADVVAFLFFSTWRIGEVRTLEWKDYDRNERSLRLRPEHSKNARSRILPVEGDIAAIIDRRLAKRLLSCPRIFHVDGRPIGDFRKTWKRACKAIGLPDRIIHDLRRSGVKELMECGVDQHTAMQFSGHVTQSMLRRYHIVDLDRMRTAARIRSGHVAQAATVHVLASEQS